MIRKRAEWAPGAPPPPAWLNPEMLGADKLRFVPATEVFVIDGGRLGVVDFLRRVDREGLDEIFASLPMLGHCQAFLVVRDDVGGSYVFSREQFWLAAYAFLNDRARERLRETLGRFGPILDAVPRFRGVLAGDKEFAQNAVASGFDIHEYSVSEKSDPEDGAAPSRPAFLRGSDGVLIGVTVPDTQRRDLAKPPQRFLSSRGPEGGRSVRGVRNLRGGARGVRANGGSSPREAAPPVEEEDVRRTPHMDLSKPEPQPGDEFDVIVYADQTAARPGEETEDIEFMAPREVREFEIEVHLTATSHFAIVQPLKKFIIKRDEPRSTSAAFKVVALSAGAEPGVVPRITAGFSFNSRACGSVSRVVQLANLPAAPAADDIKPLPPKLEVNTTARPADLIVEITNPNRDGRTFVCLVRTPGFAEPVTEDWVLNTATGQLVGEFFQIFTAPNQSPSQRLNGLLGAGKNLFKAAPKCFQDRFWQLIDAGKPPRTISILSEEPFMPWELMIPMRRGAGNAWEIREPLGVEFAVGRWVCDDHCLSPQTAPLSDSWVFAPVYPPSPRGPKPLAKAAEEAQFVQAKFPGESISPAVFDGVQTALEAGSRSLLHFVCHGASSAGGGQSIYGENNTTLNSIGLGGLVGSVAAFAAKRPFVFLNACEVGRQTPALVGVGGFAATFIDLGASCVIAPLWSVRDEVAHEIAQEFYNQTLADPAKPFAEIIRSIRARAYAAGGGEDTYAAYCFYGDPLASQR